MRLNLLLLAFLVNYNNYFCDAHFFLCPCLDFIVTVLIQNIKMSVGLEIKCNLQNRFLHTSSNTLSLVKIS